MTTKNCFFRYFILFLLFYINTTIFFCIEIPSGLQGTIIRVFRVTAKEYNLLFSAYTWPDVVLSIVGGILVDRVIGARAGYLVFTVVAIIGKGLVTVGAFVNTFYVIVAGRFIMGCGIGTMKIVAITFLGIWFKDKEITFAMSIMFCGCRVGASLGLVFPQVIYEKLHIAEYFHLYDNHYRVGFTFFFGFVFLFSSLFACVLIVILDKKGATVLGRAPFFSKKQKFQSKDLKDFGLKYWMSIVCLSLFFSVLYVFVANGQLFFTNRFGLSTKEANIANFLVFAAPILITPIVGFLVEVIGFHLLWGISGTLLAILSHALFNVVYEQSYIPYLLASIFSFSYSLNGVTTLVLPSLIVQKHQVTTAYGLFNTVLCVIFTSTSVIAGTIIDHAGFMWLEMFYIFLLSIILMLLVGIVLMEMFSTGGDRKVNKAGPWVKECLAFEKSKKFERTEKISEQDGIGDDQQGDSLFEQWQLDLLNKSNDQVGFAHCNDDHELLYSYDDLQ